MKAGIAGIAGVAAVAGIAAVAGNKGRNCRNCRIFTAERTAGISGAEKGSRKLKAGRILFRGKLSANHFIYNYPV